MATVALFGTLDTKGAEYEYFREQVRAHGADVVLVDVGVLGEPRVRPDVGREEVASAAGEDAGELARAGDRGAAVEAMGRGAAELARRMYAEGRFDAIAGLGGSSGSSIVTSAMRALPVGVPKLMVSTLASGDTRPYVGALDVTMTYSVVDIAGLNQVSRRIIANAAGAIAGMAAADPGAVDDGKPLVGATMFGVTTPCVDRARERLEELGYEVLVFHATGTGGQSLEALVRAGFLAGVLDVTTTELADELVGGVLS
ncbi:MAG TPA: Tm-1-like ATP-binding domain-containing protein, partial [Gaiellaceae bacterium]|nr:Tm-1-like ATP-binding domain-containing protein [Gaiellaceae bacterium]